MADDTVTLTQDQLQELISKAAKQAVAEAMARKVDDLDTDVPLEQPLWQRITKGKLAGLVMYTGKLGPDVDKILPERISDWFMRLEDKTVIPYTKEDALFQDKRGLVPCAANGGLYFCKNNGWKPHPRTGKERLPLILTRRFLDNRGPITRSTGLPSNGNGYTICDRYGRPANFFATELPTGLPGLRHPVYGEPHEPKWNDLPIRFATEEKDDEKVV